MATIRSTRWSQVLYTLAIPPVAMCSRISYRPAIGGLPSNWFNVLPQQPGNISTPSFILAVYQRGTAQSTLPQHVPNNYPKAALGFTSAPMGVSPNALLC